MCSMPISGLGNARDTPDPNIALPLIIRPLIQSRRKTLLNTTGYNLLCLGKEVPEVLGAYNRATFSSLGQGRSRKASLLT